jgi:hypothetical protein
MLKQAIRTNVQRERVMLARADFNKCMAYSSEIRSLQSLLFDMQEVKKTFQEGT